MVKIIDDGTMGFDNICREAELMADVYDCVIQAISKDGRKKKFGEKDKWDDMVDIDLSGKQFDEFTLEEINEMSMDKFYHEKGKQCMRDHPDIYEYWNGTESIKLHIRYKLYPWRGRKDRCALGCFIAQRKERFFRGIIFRWDNVTPETMAKLDVINPKELGQPTTCTEAYYSILEDCII